jgi:Caspase domain
METSMSLQPQGNGLWINPDWDDTKPGTFAVVIGISQYDFLAEGYFKDGEQVVPRFSQLAVSSLTAHRFFAWLQDQYHFEGVPLAKCWFLAAPTQTELGLEPALGGHPKPTHAACKDAISEWFLTMEALKKDVAEQSRAFFFFSGHGIQRTQQLQLLLPADYPNPKLTKRINAAINSTNLVNGLAALHVQKQFLYFDACRSDVQSLAKYDLIGDSFLDEGGVNSFPVAVYAAGPGQSTYQPNDPNKGISFFGQSILDGLVGLPDIQIDVQPATPNQAETYSVNTNELLEFVKRRVKQLCQEFKISSIPRVIQSASEGEALITKVNRPGQSEGHPVSTEISDIVRQNEWKALSLNRFLPHPFPSFSQLFPGGLVGIEPSSNSEYTTSIRSGLGIGHQGRTTNKYKSGKTVHIGPRIKMSSQGGSRTPGELRYPTSIRSQFEFGGRTQKSSRPRDASPFLPQLDRKAKGGAKKLSKPYTVMPTEPRQGLKSWTDVLQQVRLYDIRNQRWLNIDENLEYLQVKGNSDIYSKNLNQILVSLKTRVNSDYWLEIPERLRLQPQRANGENRIWVILLPQDMILDTQSPTAPHFTLNIECPITQNPSRRRIANIEATLSQTNESERLKQIAGLWKMYEDTSAKSALSSADFIEDLVKQLRYKKGSGLAATTAALVLLQHTIDQAPLSWLRNLSEYFPQHSDGLVLWIQSRIQRDPTDPKLIADLARLPSRGIPFTGETLAFAAAQLQRLQAVQEDSSSSLLKVRRYLDRVLRFYRPGGLFTVLTGNATELKPELVLPTPNP